MTYSDKYDELFRSADELSEYAANQLSEFFLQRFSGDLDDLFPELKEAFPKTFAAIQFEFGAPTIGVKTISGRRKVDLLFQGKEQCLVGDLYTRQFYDLYDFAECYKMLPEAIRPYYQVTEGLQVVADDGYPSLAWKGLPLSRIGRRSMSEAAEFLQLDSDYFDGIPAPPNSKVWVMSDSDLIILDEDSGQFFHSFIAQADDVYELQEPADLWDDYCGFFLRHGPGTAFQFRKP
ncbi:MAG: hypothetical protein QNJ19_17095 [Woeseiaceae bacterium]|nr:hypothetical protein [Woeseiaceae bacterium]